MTVKSHVSSTFQALRALAWVWWVWTNVSVHRESQISHQAPTQASQALEHLSWRPKVCTPLLPRSLIHHLHLAKSYISNPLELSLQSWAFSFSHKLPISCSESSRPCSDQSPGIWKVFTMFSSVQIFVAVSLSPSGLWTLAGILFTCVSSSPSWGLSKEKIHLFLHE